ncbi:MAG: putative sulfate exporter family transporter, partial [Cyclobacteriaceae bacterium]
MADTVDETITSKKKKVTIDEDWAVVVLGFIIIFLFIGGLIIPAPSYKWSSAQDLSATVFAPGNLLRIFYQFILVFVFSVLASVITNKPVRASLKVFPVLYIITVVALMLEGNGAIRSLNLEAVIFSLSIGLAIGNFFTLPAWFRSVLNAEMFVKIGLVLLGTRIIFSDILEAGSLGLVQALVVVLTVWYFAFWICKKLKLDEDLRMMISSAVSICGVSAAIATAGAIKGDPKKLSYVISLVLVTAIPMMIFMPYIAKFMGLSQEVTGAWIGGTIDTTGAVVAAGTLVGDTAVKISTIVKFSQNVLLGLAAFAISIYWTYTQKTPEGIEGSKPSLGLLWDRFPKFVLG